MAGKILFGVAGLGFMLGCSMPAQPPVQALAQLMDRNGKTVGTATFREAAGGVIVNVEVNGLSAGLHAVHVHAVGKCEGPLLPAPAAISIRRRESMVTRAMMEPTQGIFPTCWSPGMAQAVSKL